MNDDQTPERERCPFCGLRVETPCDAPPPVLCQTAHDFLLAEQAAKDAAK